MSLLFGAVSGLAGTHDRGQESKHAFAFETNGGFGSSAWRWGIRAAFVQEGSFSAPHIRV